MIASWDSIMSQLLQAKIVLQAKLRVTLYYRKIFKCNQTSRTPTGPKQPWKTMALTETSFGQLSLIFCTSGAESYQEEHWRPIWQCARFGWDDLIYMTRPSKEERIEICWKRSILKLEEDLDFISDGKLSNIDDELYQAWDVCAILLSPIWYKIYLS